MFSTMLSFRAFITFAAAFLLSDLAAHAAGTGLTGKYYGSAVFTNLLTTRTDATVNFNWGTNAPSGTVSEISAAPFSAVASLGAGLSVTFSGAGMACFFSPEIFTSK